MDEGIRMGNPEHAAAHKFVKKEEAAGSCPRCGNAVTGPGMCPECGLKLVSRPKHVDEPAVRTRDLNEKP